MLDGIFNASVERARMQDNADHTVAATLQPEVDRICGAVFQRIAEVAPAPSQRSMVALSYLLVPDATERTVVIR